MFQIDLPEYIKISKSFKNIPYNLSIAWMEYNRMRGFNMVFFTDSIAQPRILSAAIVKKIKFIGEMIQLEGLFYKDETSVKQIYGFMKDLTQLNYEAIHLAPKTLYSTTFDVAAKKAQFRAPIAQTYANLTVVVDVFNQKPDRNWRRNVKKAETQNFRFEISKDLSVEECKHLALLNQENVEMRSLKDPLSTEQVQTLLDHENTYACFLYKEDRPITARMISIEENISFDMFACNSFVSRSHGANHYLMQKIFEYLKDRQIRYFDFSEIPVGEDGYKLNGIYEFKSSSGGKVMQYNGEWWWFKNEYLRHLHYLRKLIRVK